MLVLDLDGVVTDPHSGAVNSSVLAVVIADLKRGVPVAFNTGRTLDWVEGNILPVLSAACLPRELELLCVVGEKGGVIGRIERGSLLFALDASLNPPADFKHAVRELVEDPAGPYAFAMFWDALKRTMISIERRPEVSVAEFQAVRKPLIDDLQRLLTEYNLPHFKIDPTVVATDIQHEAAGKHLGAEHILIWLEKQGIAPSTFTAVGDSPSDAAMAEVFAAVAPTIFVFVGDPATYHKPDSANYTAVITGGGYAADTATYLAEQA